MFLSPSSSSECRGFIHSVLNMDIEARPSIQQILIADWTVAEPSTRPIQLSPSNPTHKYKYTVENCLPSFLHHTKSRTSCSSIWAQMLTTPYPSTQGYAYSRIHHNNRQQQVPNNRYNSEGGSFSDSGGHAPSITSRGSAVYENAIDIQEGSSTFSLKQQASQTKKPLVSKIGACGRKIADVVKSVKGAKGRGDSAGTSTQWRYCSAILLCKELFIHNFKLCIKLLFSTQAISLFHNVIHDVTKIN